VERIGSSPVGVQTAWAWVARNEFDTGLLVEQNEDVSAYAASTWSLTLNSGCKSLSADIMDNALNELNKGTGAVGRRS